MPRKVVYEGLTELRKRFCEIHTVEPEASKAWTIARFDLGMTEFQKSYVAKVQASRAKKDPAVQAYLQECRAQLAKFFPNGPPEEPKPKKPKRQALNDKYKPEYCDAIREWFNQPHYDKSVTTIIRKNGDKIERTEFVANPPPHFGAFARSIKVAQCTLRKWVDKHPEFAEAYQEAKDMLREHIVDGGLLGTFNSHFCRLVAVNDTDMRDRTAVDVTSEDRAIAPTITIVQPVAGPSKSEPDTNESGEK